MTKKDRGEYLSHVQAPFLGSRHLCGLLRGRLSAVLGPQYHFCGLGCAGAWGHSWTKAKQVDSTNSMLLPEIVTTFW